MKKPLLALLWLLLSFILPGCQPYLTYDEMSAALEVAETPKAREKIEKRIERFEIDADKSNTFFMLREVCGTGTDHVWFCLHRGIHINERSVDRLLSKPMTLDERVKLYRRLSSACDCISRDAAISILQNF